MIKGLHHADPKVRCSAMRALSSAAERRGVGGGGAGAAAGGRLELILNVSHQEDDLLEIVGCLNDADTSCRIEALNCLTRIAPVGHIVCINAVAFPLSCCAFAMQCLELTRGCTTTRYFATYRTMIIS